MNELTIEPWLLLIPAILIICVVILGFSRIRRAVKWRAERRRAERRYGERRAGEDRRSDVRQRHDQMHNAERRQGDRRQGERRSGDAWEDEYMKIKSRLEEKQRDHRNA
ncbi:MAG: hypothetical protein IIB38_12655 [Candidatus Hydrogenedentes bacterium]|nr:hypothetical protein [Candidatus Hydrogenedentota bacterium]